MLPQFERSELHANYNHGDAAHPYLHTQPGQKLSSAKPRVRHGTNTAYHTSFQFLPSTSSTHEFQTKSQSDWESRNSEGEAYAFRTPDPHQFSPRFFSQKMDKLNSRFTRTFIIEIP